MIGVLCCTWKGLGCLVHGRWEERDEMCNRGFVVKICCYLLKQLSISFPCLEDVKLSLPWTLLIYVFMAQLAELFSFFNSHCSFKSVGVLDL